MQKLSKVLFPALLVSLFVTPLASAAKFAGPGDSLRSAKKESKKSSNQDANGESGFHPVLSLGGGLLSYIGNVKSGAGTSNFQSPTSGRGGFDIGLSQRLSNSFEFGIHFMDGTLAETERTTTATWNFKASIIGGGFNVMFKILPKQDLTPYILVGVETFGFTSNADISDPNGNPYYTWSDGTLRSLPQNAANASQAKILNLDYNYSTDIRSLNLDGSGNYSEQTFAIPVGLGFMFNLAPGADFMIGSTLHYTFTDHIDGLTPQVQGPLQGTLSHDMFLFTYISLRIHLTKEHARAKEEEEPQVTISPEVMNDTIHAAPPAHFDTSSTTLQTQYQKYTDTTGQFSKVHVDPFQWKVANPSATPTPVATATPNNNKKAAASNSAPVANNVPATTTTAPATTTKKAAKTTTPAPNSPVTKTNNTTASPGTVVYKIQLLATKAKLPDGTSFAGINDNIAVTEENGTYFYTTGNYTDHAEALKYLAQLQAFGYTDAYIKSSRTGGSAPAKATTPKQQPSNQNQAPAGKGQSAFNGNKESKNVTAIKQTQNAPVEPVVAATTEQAPVQDSSEKKKV